MDREEEKSPILNKSESCSTLKSSVEDEDKPYLDSSPTSYKTVMDDEEKSLHDSGDSPTSYKTLEDEDKSFLGRIGSPTSYKTVEDEDKAHSDSRVSDNAIEEEEPLLETQDNTVIYNEHTPLLLGGERPFRPRHWVCDHKLLITLTVLMLLVLMTLLTYATFLLVLTPVQPPSPQPEDRELKVLSLSVWGAPASFGSRDKEERIRSIGMFIKNHTEYDIFLLQELWMRPDHATIMALLPPGYEMTDVGMLAPSLCDGRVAPTFCSGLAVVSRFPIKETEFTDYSVHGYILYKDGEYWARKGTGRVRVSPSTNITLDLFLTSTCAYDYNRYYRQIQAKEFSETVARSSADLVVAAGDMNVDPRSGESTYPSITSHLQDAGKEFLKNSWLHPRFATYGNKKNSYSSRESFLKYDYLLYRPEKGPNNILQVKDFKVPILKAKTTGHSLSSHEAVEATFVIGKSI